MNQVVHELCLSFGALTQKSATTIVAGSVGADAVSVALDDGWDGLELALVFEGAGSTVRVAWDGESQVTVPWEVAASVGRVRVGVVGTDDDGRKLTAYMREGLQVVKGTPAGGDAPSEATVEQYESLVADCAAATKAAVEATDELRETLEGMGTISDAEGKAIIDDIFGFQPL